MIKWGRRRKKQQPPSTPRPSLLSSWLLRLKKMGGASDGAGNNHKAAAPVVKAAAVAPCCRSRISNRHNSSSSTTAQREEFYGGDEGFWSLSFRKEKIYSGYETEEEEDEDEEEEGEVISNFSEMVSDIRRTKELQRIKTATTTPKRRIKSDYGFCPGDQRRKSVYVNRGSPKRRNRVRVVVSPRVGAARPDDVVNCSGRSSRVKKKKEKGGLEKFAVVKRSSDPERDFRESMVEMILEMKICGAQQLEDLLACYLALNADEYHHLIIAVFRQIWFHLNCTLPPP